MPCIGQWVLGGGVGPEKIAILGDWVTGGGMF